MKNHRFIDQRSLAFDRLTAEKIAADPTLIDRARATIARWMPTASPRVQPVLCEWQAVLDGPREELYSLLAGTDERAARLRQSSPFAGVLTSAERAAILQEFARREPSAA